MAERPSWRRISLVHVNVAIYVALVVLVLAYGPQLSWAARALPLYVRGEFPYLRESELLNEARHVLATSHDIVAGKDLLEQALAIDPNSVGVFFLGEIHFVRRDLDRAMEHYARYNRIDPSYLPAYLRMAEVHELQGRDEDRRRVLQDGLSHYTRRLEEYRPRFDESVGSAFNMKAAAVYESTRQAIETLRQEIARPSRDADDVSRR